RGAPRSSSPAQARRQPAASRCARGETSAACAPPRPGIRHRARREPQRGLRAHQGRDAGRPRGGCGRGEARQGSVHRALARRLPLRGPQLVVQDLGTANGVFLWLKERNLEPGDELRIGRQRLRIEWIPEEPEQLADQPVWGTPNPGYTARVVQLLEGGGEGDVHPLKTGENLVGRGTGDVSFAHDGYVSSKHATITVGEGSLAVKDLGSANGTFVRVNGQAAVTSGDLLLLGEQIL